MFFPRYWARGGATVTGPDGQPRGRQVWHWSEVSREDARRRAEERARHLLTLDLSERDRSVYAYERPPREEVLERLTLPGAWDAAEPGDDPSDFAAITRNSYGCQVLNTRRVFFADVDLPEPPEQPSIFRVWLGAKRTTADELAGQTVEAIRAVAEARGESFRVYRTFAGLRCLGLSKLRSPESDETLALLHALDSDPLYRRLCRVQKMFRARLTPKPWRIGWSAPPSSLRTPETEAHRQALAAWVEGYDLESVEYATCRSLGDVGPRPSVLDPEIAATLAAHDAATGAASTRQLA